MKKFIKICPIILVSIFFIVLNPIFCKAQENEIKSIIWENNTLTIDAAKKITCTESRLKDPDRLIIDVLNCLPPNKNLSKTFTSRLDEKISISEVTPNQIRIIFLGSASINRKSYLTNSERTLVIRIERINSRHSLLEEYRPGDINEITVEGNINETEITISATKSIKYNSYLLKNPERLVVDLLNVTPPDSSLPKYTATPLVSGLRIGRAASGIEATRIVIDLVKPNTICDLNPTLIGNKLKITLKSSDEEEKKEEAKKLGITVVVDPGHGGYDNGASYGGYEEKNINLTISNKLKENLEESGITVYLTRDDDNFLSLAERTEITNSIKPDVFISVHANALKTSNYIRGVETYYWTSQSQKLALYVHRSILNTINIPDHFIRKARFYVIRHTSSPAVLAELGFLTNIEDRKLLTNKSTQDKYAKALSEAILKFLDIDPKPVVKGAENKNG